MSDPHIRDVSADPGVRALAFAADLIDHMISEADAVEQGEDWTKVEFAFDRYGLAEWIVYALAENGLIPPNPPTPIPREDNE